jgi:hypothetical protein
MSRLGDRDDIRPKGTVEVQCSYPGCGWCWWVDPLDPRLPDGPWDCGADHEADKVVFQSLSMLKLRHGYVWGTARGTGPKPDRPPSATCTDPNPNSKSCSCSAGSYASGLIILQDRFHSKHGVLEWKTPEDLYDVDSLPGKIDWSPEKLKLFDGGPGESKSPEAPPGRVPYVTYKLNDLIERRYTFVKCARPCCALKVMVDLADPDFRLTGPNFYSVGGYGGGDAPEPYWWGNRKFVCEDGLSQFEPQPCKLIHSVKVRALEEVTDIRWTMWTREAALFWDPLKLAFGIILCKPEYFESLELLLKEIVWGSLREVEEYLEVMIPKDTQNDIRNEIRRLAPAR